MSKEQKIDNTFSRVMSDVNRLQKAFQPDKNLEKAIAEVGGDISWLKEINESFDKLYDMLEEGHMGAVAHLQMDEEKKNCGCGQDPCVTYGKKDITEGVLDSDDDDGFMARSQLYFLARDAIKLHSVIDDRDDLEPWVASKIAQASKDMDSVRRYTEYNAMKAEVEPEMSPAPEVESIEEEKPFTPMQVTIADKNANTPAWQRFKAGDSRYVYKPPLVKEDPSKPSFPIAIKLAGDSIWDREDPNPTVVNVTDYNMDKDEEGYVSLHVNHDGPWEIYTDTGFAKAISDMIGMEVDWSEQGMQDHGVAHLEGGEDISETIRPVRSAASKLNQIGQGVRNKTNDETPAKVGEGKYGKKKKKYEAVAEETKFDDKPAHSELKTVAQDMFKNALANAKKNARK
tara:strand:- start:2621 stop:3817 length:1197 start_codon:yes stop_codon:yes gene_type:complete